MRAVRYPALFQINTRVWLTELSRALGRAATLDDIPDAELDRLAAEGFDWIWMLSVWQTGLKGQQVSRNNPEWRAEFEQTLPDLTDNDIPGSGFAITDYQVHQQLGGPAALARLRARLRERGLKLMLDFVPNHTGLDHHWVETHPEYYIKGSELDLATAPQNYTWVKRAAGDLLLAYGRDPYFSGWPDTLQLNYANPDLQTAMIGELVNIAGQCDGVRCDMAMLVLPDIFQSTWGHPSPPFWARATAAVREQHPGFCFLAEVYWDREWTLQQDGFDYTYDKRLYDRLRERNSRATREHFLADMAFQNKLARFLENHDEPRAAATFPAGVHEAAAVITFLSPGMRFFHQGQFQGRQKRISPHLNRAPLEPLNQRIEEFYSRLLSVLRRPAVREGDWQLLSCEPAWDGNWTSNCFLAFAWQGPAGERLIVAVNYAAHQSQCRVRLPFPDLDGKQWQLHDELATDTYDRDGHDLSSRGLYLDTSPWKASVFSITQVN